MRVAALDLIPHALHVMQVVGLVAVLGEHGSSLLCLLYLASSELPFGGLAVQEPAHTHSVSQYHILAAWCTELRVHLGFKFRVICLAM